jgi:hypothetical protein
MLHASGLRPDIHSRVYHDDPKTLMAAQDLARLYEHGMSPALPARFTRTTRTTIASTLKTQPDSHQADSSRVICFQCQQSGHIASRCPATQLEPL